MMHLSQAANNDGRMIWSPVHHIPQRELTASAEFVILATANGTALTLSDTHIVYVSDGSPGARVPAAARDVEVRAVDAPVRTHK